MNLPEGWKSKETDLNFSEIKKSYEGFPILGECNVEFKETPEHSVFSKYILNDHLGDKINLSDEHKVHALNHIDGVITLAQEVAKDPSKQNCVRMHSALQGNHLLDGKLRKKMNSALKVIFGEDFDGDDSVNSLLRYAHSKKIKAQGVSDSLGNAEFAIRLRPGRPKDANEWVTVEGRKVVRNPMTKRWVYEEKMEKIKKEQQEKRKKRNINPEDIQKLSDKFGKEESKKKEIAPIDGRPGFKKDRKEDNRSIEQVIKDTTSGFKSGPYDPEKASEIMKKERREAMEWAEENLDSWDMDQYTERANNAMQMCEDIENLIKNDIVPGSQTQGIYQNGRLVGGLMTSGENQSYVEVLFSSPANAFPGYPKATKGAGTQGILMAIQNTRKHGGDGSISLRSKSDALDFYKKLGFEPVGKYGKMVLSAEKAEALAKKHGVEFDEDGDNQDLPIYAVSNRVRKYLRKKSSANFGVVWAANNRPPKGQTQWRDINNRVAIKNPSTGRWTLQKEEVVKNKRKRRKRDKSKENKSLKNSTGIQYISDSFIKSSEDLVEESKEKNWNFPITSMIEINKENFEEIKKEYSNGNELNYSNNSDCEFLGLEYILKNMGDNVKIYLPKKSSYPYADFIVIKDNDWIPVQVKKDGGRISDLSALSKYDKRLLEKESKTKTNQIVFERMKKFVSKIKDSKDFNYYTRQDKYIDSLLKQSEIVANYLNQKENNDNEILDNIIKKTIFVNVDSEKKEISANKVKDIEIIQDRLFPRSSSIKKKNGKKSRIERWHARFKYVLGEKLFNQEEFSDSIKNAIDLLSGSKDFSEKAFDIFMREQEWQAI